MSAAIAEPPNRNTAIAEPPNRNTAIAEPPNRNTAIEESPNRNTKYNRVCTPRTMSNPLYIDVIQKKNYSMKRTAVNHNAVHKGLKVKPVSGRGKLIESKDVSCMDESDGKSVR
ncbi:hypothetical protein TNCV_4775991 [Trichonephila clavipes]|nr:hypothetical protein TNCV_4775991 [Trichonephila clavipes]